MQDIEITVVGTIVSDIRLVTPGDGAARASFRVVFNRRRFDRASERYIDLDTAYFGVTCWRELAENVAWSMRKGDPVVVHGRLRVHDREEGGAQRRYVDIDADAVGHNLRWGTTLYRRVRRVNPAESAAPAAAAVTAGPPVPSPDEAPAARPAAAQTGEGVVAA